LRAWPTQPGRPTQPGHGEGYNAVGRMTPFDTKQRATIGCVRATIGCVRATIGCVRGDNGTAVRLDDERLDLDEIYAVLATSWVTCHGCCHSRRPSLPPPVVATASCGRRPALRPPAVAAAPARPPCHKAQPNFQASRGPSRAARKASRATRKASRGRHRGVTVIQISRNLWQTAHQYVPPGLRLSPANTEKSRRRPPYPGAMNFVHDDPAT
jgi:hypothetical protein